MTTFTDLMDQYSTDNAVSNAIESVLDNAEFAQCLLHYLVVDAVVCNKLRDMARYTAKFLSQYKDTGIHEKTKPILRRAELKQNLKYGIGYLHADGTYHWFAVEGSIPESVQSEDGYEALKQTMLKFDWYYHFTDDFKVWQAEDAAYKAMIQQCKDLGLSKEDAIKLQKLCLEERGITSMEGVAYITY